MCGELCSCGDLCSGVAAFMLRLVQCDFCNDDEQPSHRDPETPHVYAAGTRDVGNARASENQNSYEKNDFKEQERDKPDLDDSDDEEFSDQDEVSDDEDSAEEDVSDDQDSAEEDVPDHRHSVEENVSQVRSTTNETSRVSSMAQSSISQTRVTYQTTTQLEVRSIGENQGNKLPNTPNKGRPSGGQNLAAAKPTQVAKPRRPVPHRGPVSDAPDPRDKVFQLKAHNDAAPPQSVLDLRRYCPPVWNQGHIMMGSSAAFAVAAAFEWEVNRLGLPPFSPSRLALWYNARAKLPSRKSISRNVSVRLRDAIKALGANAAGVCDERYWPYEASGYHEKTFMFNNGAKAIQKPPPSTYKHPHSHIAIHYLRITKDINHMLNCLNQGHPFLISVNTYGRLTNLGKSHVLTKAQKKKRHPHNHAMLVVGYIPGKKQFIVRNSFGPRWGDGGYFMMTYDCAVADGTDVWTIRLVVSK